MRKILPLLLFVFLLSANLLAQKVVGYYYGSYSVYPPSVIQFENLTHISHAFIRPNADGTLAVPSWYLLPELITEAHKHGVKVLVALGGYDPTADANFRSLAASSAARKTFASKLADFCKQYGYDGADIDWEYPKGADAANYVLMVTEIRQAFNTAGIPLVSAALPSTDWNNGYDIAKLTPLLDWFGIMTYDIGGTWEKAVYHTSPLYPSPQASGSVDNSARYYANKGMPKDKMLTGMAFYGYKYTAAGMYQSHTAGEGSSITYVNAEALRNSTDWDYFWDNTAKVPYLQNKARTQVVSYDDTASIRLKCNYIKSSKLGGTIIWALHQSYNGRTSPLLNVIGDNLLKNTSTGVDNKYAMTPKSFELKNYPNPFNPSTTVTYSVPEPGVIKISVYDVLGRLVQDLVSQQKEPGEYKTTFDASGLESGIYFCRLSSGRYVQIQKMVLLR
ncbi:MAG TPA: glycosyl hydrolase family 18 protein [Ignavibacteriales bacterium]|nr:glycosyl hydrolase family 18 protein [Ignavibacteriales bacterium]